MSAVVATSAVPSDSARGRSRALPSTLSALPTDLVPYLQALTHQWAQVLATLGFILIPLFFILDVFMMPTELLPRFAVYRATTTGIVIAQYFAVRLSRPGRWVFLHGYFFSFVVGLMIAMMTTDLGGFDSTYYAGLNLVLIATNLLLPWEFWHSAINGAMILGMYVGLNLWVEQAAPASSGILLNNLYFLSATAVITVSINFVKQRLIKDEFFLRKDLKTARDALWGEMEVAKHIQTALLPKVHDLPGYRVAATMQPAAEVGGDYYDILASAKGDCWVCVGDVSGHGVASGLIMMMAQTSLFTTVRSRPEVAPSQALAEVNSVLRKNIQRMGADRYMTLMACRLHDATLEYAGLHQDILVYRAKSGQVETLPTAGSWIGLVDDLAPHLSDQQAEVSVGDVLLFFTDGVTECVNAQGEMFGQERLRQALARHGNAEAHVVIDRIFHEVRAHMHLQSDDITLVALRRV